MNSFDSQIIGERSETNVIQILTDLKTRIVEDFRVIKKYEWYDMVGIDIIVKLKNSKILIPIQIKSSESGIKAHYQISTTNIPAVNGFSSCLQEDLIQSLNNYKEMYYLSLPGFELCMIDAEVHDAMREHNWFASKRTSGLLEAVCRQRKKSDVDGSSRWIYLHQEIYKYYFGEIPINKKVCFLNSNRLDIRRENLILIDKNKTFRKSSRRKTYLMRGVYKTPTGRFYAQIQVLENGHRKYIRFGKTRKTSVEAFRDYLILAKQYYGVDLSDRLKKYITNTKRFKVIFTKSLVQNIKYNIPTNTWYKLEELILAPRRGKHGKRSQEDRRHLEVMNYKIQFKCSWIEAEDYFNAPRNSVFLAIRRWKREGVFEDILHVLNLTWPDIKKGRPSFKETDPLPSVLKS